MRRAQGSDDQAAPTVAVPVAKAVQPAPSVAAPVTGDDHTLAATSNTASGRGLSGRSAPGVAESDLKAGEYVGEYAIERVLGRGGFGTVYRAVHPVIGKHVAIKVLSRKYSADNEMVSRFVAEARAVNQIRHRHIIDIFSFGNLPDGRAYYVMEHLEGDPLDRYLAERGPLPLAEALPILRAIARALDAAHAKGIAHRDLKPENIFLARDDDGALFPKLLDFGIAKLMGQEEALAHKTNTGVPIGTPYYMSPEQCRGRDVDHRTDIYSFGVLCYRVLTGTYPFEGDLIEILHKQMHEQPPAPSTRNRELSHAIDETIAWMMHKDPGGRPKSVIAAVVALQDDKTPTPMLTPERAKLVAAAAAKYPKAPSRRSWIVPALAITLLVAGGVTAYIVFVHGSSTASTAPPSTATPSALPTTTTTAATITTTTTTTTTTTAPVVEPTKPVEAGSAAPSEAAVPKLVTITILGAPPGVEVAVAGRAIGVTPDVQLERGTSSVLLTLAAPGYLTTSVSATPDKDQTVKVSFKPRPKAKPITRSDRDSLEPPPSFETR